MLPRVAVIIPTYRRSSLVLDTVEHLQDHLKYDGKIHYYIGDDSPDEDTRNLFSEAALENVFLLQSPRRGLGANLNCLLEATRKFEYVLQMDDDHWLVKDLDITRHVEYMVSMPQVGCVRLMGIGGHRYNAELHGSYWWLRWDSPELYLTSNHPHLKRRSFHDAFGMYEEGLRLGETEDSFCHHTKMLGRSNLNRFPVVVVPLDVLTESSWEHVGKSWQSEGL